MGTKVRMLRLSFEGTDGEYLITAALDDGPPVTGKFVLPISDDVLTSMLGELGESRSLTEQVAQVEAAPESATRTARLVPRRQRTAEDFGSALADALFAGEVGALFEQARREGDVQLRIGLTETQTELLKVPWEFLCRRGIFVAAQPSTPVLRELWIRDDQPVLGEPPDKIRILAVSASPAGLEVLDTAGERARLEAVVAAHGDAAELQWIDGCTFDMLHDGLRTHPHVFHFVGHGFCDDNGDAGIVLCRDDGSAHLVSALAFTNLVALAESLRLIVLNSCEGFRAVAGQPYASLAAKLVRVGRSAVIAMQFKITDSAAIKFSEALYERVIAERMSIDRAVSEARIAVMGVNEIAFATPVLYLRDGETELFRGISASDAAVAAASSAVPATPQIGVEQKHRLGDRPLMLATPNLVGDDVVDLQSRLRSIGLDTGPVDGLFGPATAAAVEAFQHRAGLTADGVCGPLTIAALDQLGAQTDVATDQSGGPSTAATPIARSADIPPPHDPGPPQSDTPSEPPNTMPAQSGGGGSKRALLIGAGVASMLVLTLVLAVGMFGGNDAGDASSASIVPSAAGPSDTAATDLDATDTVGPDGVRVDAGETGQPAATVPLESSDGADAELFGFVTKFPRLPIGPTYAVDRDAVGPGEDPWDCAVEPDPAVDDVVVVSGGDDLTTTRITMQATDQLTEGVAVAIEDVYVEVLDWLPPIDGVLFDCGNLPATDAAAPIELYVTMPDSETAPPIIEYRIDRGNSSSGVVAPVTEFPSQVVLRGETLFFDVVVDSTSCDCEWIVVFEMVVNGKAETVEIWLDVDVPFRTTGPANSTRFTSAA